MSNNELYDVKRVLDYHVFKVIWRTDYNYEELYNIAHLGYLKAQKAHKNEGQMSLSFASSYIRRELQKEIQKEYNFNRAVNNARGEEEEHYNQSYLYFDEQVKRVLPKLTDREQHIIEELYLSESPKRLVDLAKHYSVTKQRIDQIRNKALEKIRIVLGVDI